MNYTASLLAADVVLPQRDLLLDQPVMVEYLSRLLARYGEFGIRDCVRLRTKYRVGTSLRVLYELSGDKCSYRVAARAFPTTRRVDNQFTSALEIQAPELNTIFWIFPRDRKIKNLSLLNEPPLELSEIEGREWVESRVVGHAPEKSVTAQCLGRDRRILAYAKIYAGNEGREIFNLYNYVGAALKTDTTTLRVPRAIAYHDDHNLLLLESISGSLLTGLTSAHRETVFFRLGQTLKKLHLIAPPSLLPHCDRFSAEGLAQTAATITQARPDVAVPVQKITDRLHTQSTERSGGEPVFLHGDVHSKNILFDQKHLVLLDLDQAAVGAAEVDLGSVIASLYCEACVGSFSWRQSLSLARAFLTGYGVHKISPALRWQVAAALTHERVLRSVTRIRTANLQKLPQLLQTANAVLNGGILENQV